jgi:hypothetical protein
VSEWRVVALYVYVRRAKGVRVGSVRVAVWRTRGIQGPQPGDRELSKRMDDLDRDERGHGKAREQASGERVEAL